MTDITHVYGPGAPVPVRVFSGVGVGLIAVSAIVPLEWNTIKLKHSRRGGGSLRIPLG